MYQFYNKHMKFYPLKRQSQLQPMTIYFIFFYFLEKKVLTFHVNHLKNKKKMIWMSSAINFAWRIKG